MSIRFISNCAKCPFFLDLSGTFDKSLFYGRKVFSYYFITCQQKSNHQSSLSLPLSESFPLQTSPLKLNLLPSLISFLCILIQYLCWSKCIFLSFPSCHLYENCYIWLCDHGCCYFPIPPHSSVILITERLVIFFAV